MNEPKFTGSCSGNAGPFTLSITETKRHPPAHPDSLVAHNELLIINLCWSHVAAANGFNVYRMITPDVPTVLTNLIGSPVSASFVYAGVTTAAVR